MVSGTNMVKIIVCIFTICYQLEYNCPYKSVSGCCFHEATSFSEKELISPSSYQIKSLC